MSDITLPTIEATLRSPLGEIRVWVDAEGQFQTELRCSFPSSQGAAETGATMAALADLLAASTRSLAVRTSGPRADGAVDFFGWFADRCEPDPHARMPTTALFEDYLAWCANTGVRAISQRAFADALSDRSVRLAGKDRFGRKLRGGVRLRPTTPTLVQPDAA